MTFGFGLLDPPPKTPRGGGVGCHNGGGETCGAHIWHILHIFHILVGKGAFHAFCECLSHILRGFGIFPPHPDYFAIILGGAICLLFLIVSLTFGPFSAIFRILAVHHLHTCTILFFGNAPQGFAFCPIKLLCGSNKCMSFATFVDAMMHLFERPAAPPPPKTAKFH